MPCFALEQWFGPFEFWHATLINCAVEVSVVKDGSSSCLTVWLFAAETLIQAQLLKEALQQPLGSLWWWIAAWRGRLFWCHLRVHAALSPLLILASNIGIGPKFIEQGAESLESLTTMVILSWTESHGSCGIV